MLVNRLNLPRSSALGSATWLVQEHLLNLSRKSRPAFALVAFEDVASIDFVFYVIQTTIVPICDDGLGLLFELGEIIDNEAAEEGGAVLEGGFIDDDLGAFGFDALHNALDGALAEVVGVRLHR